MNCVNPGVVDTPLWDGVPKDVLQGFCKDLQMFGRATKAHEVTNLAVARFRLTFVVFVAMNRAPQVSAIAKLWRSCSAVRRQKRPAFLCRRGDARRVLPYEYSIFFGQGHTPVNCFWRHIYFGVFVV